MNRCMSVTFWPRRLVLMAFAIVASSALGAADLVVAYPGGDNVSVIHGLNNNGTVVGLFTNGQAPCIATTSACSFVRHHGFVYYHGEYRELKSPFEAHMEVIPTAVNNKDQAIVSISRHGTYLYDIPAGMYFPIGTQARVTTSKGPVDFVIEQVLGLNDKGEILFVFGNGMAYGVPLLGPAGDPKPPNASQTFTGLPGCGEAFPLIPVGINNNDDIAGRCYLGRGFLYSNGTMHFLPIPDAAMVMPQALNNKGIVAGMYQAQKRMDNGRMMPVPGLQFFVYDGTSVTNPSLLPPAYSRIVPNLVGLNDRGQVVLQVGGGLIVNLP